MTIDADRIAKSAAICGRSVSAARPWLAGEAASASEAMRASSANGQGQARGWR